MECHPIHISVEEGISGLIVHIGFADPFLFSLFQSMLYCLGIRVVCHQLLFCVCLSRRMNSQENAPASALSRLQTALLKGKGADGLTPGSLRPGCLPDLVRSHTTVENAFGMGKASALSDKVLHFRADKIRVFSIVIRSIDKISQGILFMTTLIKCERRSQFQSCVCHLHSMEQTGDMPVVPQIISRTAIDRDRRHGDKGYRLCSFIPHGNLHHFKGSLVTRYKRGDL